jgi:hypothetical protein
MKRLTLKWKIMLWFTALLILLLGMALPFMYFKLSSYMYSSAEAVLQAEVNRVAESLERENHEITIEGAEIDLVEAGNLCRRFLKRQSAYIRDPSTSIFPAGPAAVWRHIFLQQQRTYLAGL